VLTLHTNSTRLQLTVVHLQSYASGSPRCVSYQHKGFAICNSDFASIGIRVSYNGATSQRHRRGRAPCKVNIDYKHAFA
jgi:hypothetical protein